MPLSEYHPRKRETASSEEESEIDSSSEKYDIVFKRRGNSEDPKKEQGVSRQLPFPLKKTQMSQCLMLSIKLWIRSSLTQQLRLHQALMTKNCSLLNAILRDKGW